MSTIPGFRSDAEGGSLRWLCDYQRLLVNAFIGIETTGFPFDTVQHGTFIDNAKRIYAQYEKKLRADKQFKSYCKKNRIVPANFNFNSADQLRKFLFAPQVDEGLSLEPFKRSKTTDKPSTDRESLDHFADEGSLFCKDLVVLRNFSKLLSSFGEPLLQFYSPITGAVHPNYFLAKVIDGSGAAGGTHTGRLSCKNPNMQQIPKRDKDDKGVGLAGIDVRRSFVPLDGHVLIEADQSQVEVRVAGMYAKDEQMGQFFRAGGDFHSRVAAQVFQEDYEEFEKARKDAKHPKHDKVKQQRSAAKRFTFGLMFGMGLTKLTRQSGMTEAEGRQFIDDYFATFPHFADWREDMIQEAKENGYVTTLFGRKRVIKLSGYATDDGREERIGINTPIQSAAADITLYGLSRIWEMLQQRNAKTRILGTVHDSIILSMPPEEVNPVLPIIADMMVRPPGLDWLLDEVPVPLDIGVDIGPNFRDMTELDTEQVLAGEVDVKEYI
jgi:DNA polymerase-1